MGNIAPFVFDAVATVLCPKTRAAPPQKKRTAVPSGVILGVLFDYGWWELIGLLIYLWKSFAPFVFDAAASTVFCPKKRARSKKKNSCLGAV